MRQVVEKFLVSELGTIAALNGQYYPIAAPVGDIDPPFCIYTRISGAIKRDLSGEPVYYRDIYRLDLAGEDADDLFTLEADIIEQLTKTNVAFEDIYVYSAEASPGDPDGFDLTIEVNQRSVTYAVTYWR